MKNKYPDFRSQFEEDVRAGLTAPQKFLFSKYFYDEQGDKIFQEIMAMPEYYLTKREFDILQEHKDAIHKMFNATQGFDLIELGAGDGKKTKILLKHFVSKDSNFSYLPIDISQHALDDLEKTLREELPELRVQPQQGMYFQVLERLEDYNKRKKVIMVLGSNIGNLQHSQAVDFLRNIRNAMGADDLLFMGFDQKKDPRVILNAYNDKAGITEAFNKNVLVRINKEMDADFQVDSFLHWPTYNPETGTTKSFLISSKKQMVQIKKLDLTISFDAYESIHTEISQKYDDHIVKWLADQAGLKVERHFTDSENYYKNYIFRNKNVKV